MSDINGIQLENSEKDGIIKFSLKGRLYGLNADQTLEKMSAHIAGKKNVKVVVDFSFLDYISSAGLRIFILFGKNVNAVKGSMAMFFEDNDTIYKLFTISGLNNIFQLTSKESEAHKLVRG